MAEAKYTHFIPQNTATAEAVRIEVYNSAGRRVGRAGLQNLMLQTTQEKQYSFLCLSDSHIDGSAESVDSQADFIRALKYAGNDSGISFTTVCGDVVDHSGADNYFFQTYQNLVFKYNTKPIYPVTGNHESNNGGPTPTHVNETAINEYYGDRGLYYSFSQGDDVFIMLGTYGWNASYPLFKRDGDEEVELKWLQATLEENRNKRCFVFFHVFNTADWVYSDAEGKYVYSKTVLDSGEPYPDYYGGDLLNYGSDSVEQKKVFLDLLKHYKNTIWFHGHSHARFQLQELAKTNNYSEQCGYRSVHIPSLCKPTKPGSDGVKVEDTSESQGYIVDVYPDGIHLRGRDFVAGEFLPIASYWIDTTLQNVEANTFTDDTGLIIPKPDEPDEPDEPDTPSTEAICGQAVCGEAICGSGTVEPDESDIALVWSTGVKLNTTTGAEESDSRYAASDYIEFVDGGTYTLYRSQDSAIGVKVCYYDENKNFLSASEELIQAGVSGNLSAVVPTVSGAKYFRVRFYNGSGVTAESCAKVTLTVEEQDTPVEPDEPTVPDTTLVWSYGVKLNSSTGAEESGTAYAASNYIEFVDGWTYTLHRSQDSAIGAKVCYYDENKNFLSTTGNELITAGVSGDLSAVVPNDSGAKYFRVRFYSSNGATAENCAKVTLTAAQ